MGDHLTPNGQDILGTRALTAPGQAWAAGLPHPAPVEKNWTAAGSQKSLQITLRKGKKACPTASERGFLDRCNGDFF